MSTQNNVTALILAAGESVRLGQSKVFIEWQGKTLLQHALERVAPFAAQIIVGVRECDLPEARQISGSNIKVTTVAGGSTRQETLEHLTQLARGEIILIHEAARPFAHDELFQRVLEELQQSDIIVPAVKLPVRDGIGLCNGDFLELQLPREQLVSLQVPQAIYANVLREILQRARKENLKADSIPGLALSCGYRVRLVKGCENNLKITYQDDLKWLEK